MAHHPSVEPPKILYVDDDPGARDLFREQVGARYLVATAPSGVAGLELLAKEGPFAVVVSDLKMDGMTGIGFLSRARQSAPDSVRILITGQANLWAAIQGVNDGHIFRFLNKPVPRDVLLRHLDAAADEHRVLTARGRPPEQPGLGTRSASRARAASVAPNETPPEGQLPTILASLSETTHEMNNAIAPILGFAELLAEADAARDPETVKRYADQILAGAENLQALVDALRRLYRPGAEVAEHSATDWASAGKEASGRDDDGPVLA
ncbi:MAG: response regulator [Chloroflexi bacterium]|nr:response regulator [Chloroflexota bacterium]